MVNDEDLGKWYKAGALYYYDPHVGGPCYAVSHQFVRLPRLQDMYQQTMVNGIRHSTILRREFWRAGT